MSNICDFYREYSTRPKMQPLVAEISWTIFYSDKNKTVVEYALRAAGRPIGVATYAVVSQLPEAYRGELPSPEAIAERLRSWDLEKTVDDE